MVVGEEEWNEPLSLAQLIVYSYVGQTGLGKSTLVNTLFASHLVESKGRIEPEVVSPATTEISGQSHGSSAASSKSTVPKLMIVSVITENGVKLRLNIIDTPGYGDMINNEGCWDPIIKHVSLRKSAWETPVADTRRRSKTNILHTFEKSSRRCGTVIFQIRGFIAACSSSIRLAILSSQ